MLWTRISFNLLISFPCVCVTTCHLPVWSIVAFNLKVYTFGDHIGNGLYSAPELKLTKKKTDAELLAL